MIYEYYNEEKNKILEFDFPFGEAPKFVEVDGTTYSRFFGNVSATIPYGFIKDYNEVKFDKSPSGRKHFY